MEYTIKPLFFGNMFDLDKSTFTFRTDPGVKIEAPLLAYLVEGGGHKILVDTGIGDDAVMDRKYHKPLHGRTSLRNALAKEGLSFGDICAVILTHLHWDHSYNLDEFGGVPVYVQQREAAYELNPIPCDLVPSGVDPRNGLPQWLAGYHSFMYLNGDVQLFDGITAVFLPGHTPGIQGVLVQTAEGKYLIGSDNFPLYENFEKGIPSGIHVDLREWYASFEKAKGLADFILPGHDPKVLERNVYGKL